MKGSEMTKTPSSSGLATPAEYAQRALDVLEQEYHVHVPPSRVDRVRADFTKLFEGACSLARAEEKAAQVRGARFRGCS